MRKGTYEIKGIHKRPDITKKAPLGTQILLHSQRGNYYNQKSVHSTCISHLPKIMVTIYNHTFRVKYYKNYPEVNTMKGRILTENQIAAFAVYLKNEEKSENTVEKYIRDVRAFATYPFSLPLVSRFRYSTLLFRLMCRKCRCPHTPMDCCSSSGSFKQGM